MLLNENPFWIFSSDSKLVESVEHFSISAGMVKRVGAGDGKPTLKLTSSKKSSAIKSLEGDLRFLAKQGFSGYKVDVILFKRKAGESGEDFH